MLLLKHLTGSMTKKYNSCISNNLASNGDEMKKLIGAEVKSLQNMVSRHIENKEKEMGKDRVSAPNLFILKFLQENEGKEVFQRDLEEVLETTKSTCSKVISTMESKGFLKRESVADARFNKISLTPLGREIVKTADVHMEEFESKLKRGLTDEQLETFFYCIETMKRNISQK